MPRRKVIINKISDRHYELACSVGGRKAIVILSRMRQDWVNGDTTEYLQYREIAHESLPGLGAKHGERIFPWFEKGDMAMTHAYFKEIDVRMEDGIDAYCPECDAI